MPKKEKPIKLEKCRICFKELSGKQKQFCSDNCRVQYRQIRIKFEELRKINPNLQVVMWNQADNPKEKLAWNTIVGTEHKPYKKIKKVLTKKKSKSR